MNDKGKFAGVIFDLDGTLYRMSWILRPLLTLKVFPHILRLPRFMKIRGSFAGKEMGSRVELLDAISESLSRIEKISAQQAKIWILDTFYPAFVSTMPFFRNSRPDTDMVLSRLHEAGVKLAVLSDYDSVKDRLDGLGIQHSLFHTITSSEASGALKPSPKPLLEIASQWQLSPEQILVVGDRDDTDGEAARAAGMSFLRIIEKKDGSGSGRLWGDVVKELLLQTA